MNKGEDNFKLSDARWNDVNVVSSLLKSFFRKLPDPLFTLDLYSDFIEMSKVDEAQRRLRGLKGLVQDMPDQNYETLKFVCVEVIVIPKNVIMARSARALKSVKM